jgi:Xaa-Pro aminopeptidase
MFEAKFQTFNDLSDPTETPQRIAALRAALTAADLQGFIVPHADRHQSEYLPASDERLAWLTGFTGSAGTAIVLADRAALFTDGRYTIQAAQQVDPTLISIVNITDQRPAAWIESELPPGARLGYDPWLHTIDDAERLEKACAKAGATLVAVDENLVDLLWRDRPTEPLGRVALHEQFAGESVSAKRTRIMQAMQKHNADVLVMTDPTSIAWTFNIRGHDIAHTPVALGFALLRRDQKPLLFIDGRKLTPAVEAALQREADLREPDVFMATLSQSNDSPGRVMIDKGSAASAIVQALTCEGVAVLRQADPVTQLKAIKNETEIAGARAAHERDGAALVRFLAWFDREAPQGKLTEIDAVKALESFRRDTGLLKDVSFPTIAGSGPNGAIVHYRVTEASNRRIAANEFFLLDSGAQYEDGTTDVTRTISVGAPSDEMRDRFTRVLNGHIAIARANFPEGTTGAQLDSFARRDLWNAGLDFDHGTGHGVGSYLSVHEGPARISKLGSVALKRGMILSNEPGYYKTGAYGIRTENLVLVVEAPTVAGAEKPLNAFETLTLAPIDRRAIIPAQMTADDRAWLDAYHARVRDTLTPLLDSADRQWLARATAPL